MNICLCTKDDSYRIRKNFESYDELLKWTQEKIEESKIEVGDIVTIENYGDMYATLDVTYFKNLWAKTEIDYDVIYRIMIHYDYGRDYGVGYNDTKEKDRVKWKVLFIYENRIFIERLDDIHEGQVLCVGKEGLKKYA